MTESKLNIMQALSDTPWKLGNEIRRWLCYPFTRLIFTAYGVPWKTGWKLSGIPILQKHKQSTMRIGNFLQLRSFSSSNPLAPKHPVVLCTWQAGAVLEIENRFAMTGGVLCSAERITIGNDVVVGANCIIMDTDFHPLNSLERRKNPQAANTSPILIEDDAFIGMNCMILKGVTVGRGSVIGAGSVVTRDVPEGTVVAGNPARIIKNKVV